MKPVRFYIQVRSERAADRIEKKIRALLKKETGHTFARGYDPFAINDLMAKESGRMVKTIAGTVTRVSPWLGLLKSKRFPENLSAK